MSRIRLLPDPPAEEFYRRMGALYSGVSIASRVEGGPVFREMVIGVGVSFQRVRIGDDLRDLQFVLDSAPEFHALTTGSERGRAEASDVVNALPPRKSHEDKFVFVVDVGESRRVGCIDLIRGYPDDETAWIGLLLIDESRHGRGFGASAFSEIERLVATWDGIRRLRLSVVATNERVVPFWMKMGFVATGERRMYRVEDFVSEVILFEKVLGGGAG